MPQNTPMKRQFITIDGRTVMSNLPQHWGGNDWAITGVDNPLPVGNYVQTDSGVWIPQKGSDDGAADVRLTGSNVEQVKLFNALAIADTSSHTSASIDVSNYSKITLLAKSTLNQPVYLGLRINPDGSGFSASSFWSGDKWVGGYMALGFDEDDHPKITGDPEDGWQNVNSFWPFLNDVRLTGRFSLYARCKIAPTSGELTVMLIGGVS